jgi:hypothetical protein
MRDVQACDCAVTKSLSSTPRIRDRWLVAFGVACAAGLVVAHFAYANSDPSNASDFTWYWRAGRAMLARESPYRVINATGPYPYNEGFLYPLPAALIAAPFATLAMWPAMVGFCATLAGCLAFILTRDGFWRLPILMSFPMVWCAQSGQLAPLGVAAAMAPMLGGFAIAKPTLAIAAFAYAPRKRFIVSAAIMLGITLVVAPTWPNEYVAELRVRTAANYHIPLLILPGPLLLLAALRWRRPEARLLLAMACVPQTMLFYDQLPLLLIARTFRQSLVLALGSYLPIVAIYVLPRPADDSLVATLATTSTVIVWLYYLPCLVEVLRRPNVGNVPRVIERCSTSFPSWLKGSSLGNPGATP